jgi:DNA-binding SARP family transcriptional activator/predicted ATPase
VERYRGGEELWIGLLGGFRVVRCGHEIPISAWQKRGTAQALVKLLALARGHRLHRDQVLDVVWPDLDPEAADRAFRKALHYARHALEPDLTQGRASRYLLLQGGTVSLASDLVTVDAACFRDRGQEALKRADPEALEQALSLYTGELLPGDRYEDWVAVHREELSTLHLQLLTRLADVLSEQGKYAAAIDRLHEVLTVDPLREDVHRAIMGLHVRAGSVHAALRQYMACAEILRHELDVEPEAETEELRARISSNRFVMPGAAQSRQLPLPHTIRRSPDTALVGRERALELLMEACASALHGTGEALLIGGEAGVGKTRLVAEAAREGHRHGAAVLWGSSHEAEGPLPYGAIVEALEGYLVDAPYGERARIVHEFPLLARLLPSLSPLEAFPLDLTTGGDKTRLFASVVRLFRDLASDAPVILVLDDLHAADPATQQLFHHLARAATNERWVLVATYREEEAQAGSELHRMRAALTRAGICRRIDLHRLARTETERLIRELLAGGTIPAHMTDELYSLSAGNPLFLQELVQTMRQRGQVTLVEGEWQEQAAGWSVPSGVRDLVEERVHRLGEVTERMLAVAAVAGMDMGFDLLHAATGLGLEPLLGALDRALAAQVLEESGPGYVFRHPLVRAALYDRLTERRRIALHATVARALETVQPEAVETLAYHFVRGGDDDKAIIYLERAGDHAATTFANEAAIEFYSDALTRVARRGEAATLARIGGKLGNVQSTLGQLAAAEASYEQALGSAHEPLDRLKLQRLLARTWEKRGEFSRALAVLDAAEAEAQATGGLVTAVEHVEFLIGRAEALLGLARVDDALAVAEEALGILEDEPDDLHQAQVHYIQARAAMQRGDYTSVLAICQRGLGVAEAAGDVRGTAACLSGMTVAATNLGDMQAAEAYQRRGIQIAERTGDLHSLAIGWNNLGVSAHARGDYESARECYEKCIRIREEIDDKEGLAVSWVNMAEASLFQGSLDDADEECARSLSFYEETDDAYGISYVAATRAAIAYHRGRLAEAEDRWRESLEIRTRIGDRPGTVDTQLGLAEIAFVQGRLAEAYQTARQMRHIVRGRAPELEARATLLEARVRVAQRRTRQAETLIAHARRLAQQHDLGRIAIQALLAEAERCIAVCDFQPAVRTATEALESARRRGLRLEEGIAHRLLGVALLGEGTYDAGMSALTCSSTVLHCAGAMLEAGRTDGALEAARP